jgi:hypothetical protein
MSEDDGMGSESIGVQPMTGHARGWWSEWQGRNLVQLDTCWEDTPVEGFNQHSSCLGHCYCLTF